MNIPYGCNDDYLDEDDDGIMYSTRDYCSDSDDETLSANFFQPKHKKKTPGQNCFGQESGSEDEFEKEMSSELSLTMQKLTAPLLPENSNNAQSRSLIEAQPEYYDDIYFDSEGSEPEEMSESPQTSKSKHKKRILTNDELFYDPNLDDDDQAWVDRKRRSYQLLASRRLPKSEGALKPKPLPRSDAVLNCPACFTTLCLDCQRHEIYKDQYRAMFVFNCTVDSSECLHFSKKEDKKKKFKKVVKKKYNQTKSEATVPLNSAIAVTSSASNINELSVDACNKLTNTSAQGITDSAPSESFSTHHDNSSSNGNEGATVVKGSNESNELVIESSSVKDEDRFNPVKCTVCGTKVAVYDRDEVYHFFNIITSY